MNPAWWINLILLGLIGVLVILVVFEPHHHAPQEMDLPRLTTLQADAVHRIHIASKTNLITLERADDQHWYLREPLQLAADESKVAGLLQILNARSKNHIESLTADLSEFGLAPPQAVLSLNQTHFEFGNSTPLNGLRYVRVEEKIHLVRDVFFYKLGLGAENLVHPSPLGLNPELIDIATDTYHILLENGHWRHAEADRQAANFMYTVHAWQHLQAIQVSAYVPLAAGESSLSAQVRVTGSETPLEFEIRADQNELILARPQAKVMYHIANRDSAGLLNLQQLN